MAYYRYTRLQQYIGGQPTDVYTKGQRADSTEYTTYEDCMAGSDVTRWVAIPQTTCVDGDLWSMEKEQATFDGGETWADTGNTRPVAVIEPDSDRCTGADSDWRIVTGEYICNGTSKCVKEVEYVNVEGSWVPSGRTRAGSIIEILSADCGVMYQWVNVPGEYICVFKCGRGDKYTKQKQQYSLDGGTSWSDTGETREGDFVEKNSAYCGCDTSVTRWITVEGEYVCVGTSKYTKEKEQTSADGTVWTDTGNTRAGSLIETSSSSCQNVQTRWVTASGQYSCVGYDKYSMDKEQQSTDGGTTWTDTGNTRAGSTLIEANSSDCGYHPQSITRWVTVSGEYMCDGNNKMNKEKEQISYDSGSTWSDTGATRAGSTLIEADSPDCGYVPPAITRWVIVSGDYVCVGNDKYNREKEQISYDEGVTWTDTGAVRAGSTLIETDSQDCITPGDEPDLILKGLEFSRQGNFGLNNTSYFQQKTSISVPDKLMVWDNPSDIAYYRSTDIWPGETTGTYTNIIAIDSRIYPPTHVYNYMGIGYKSEGQYAVFGFSIDNITNTYTFGYSSIGEVPDCPYDLQVDYGVWPSSNGLKITANGNDLKGEMFDIVFKPGGDNYSSWIVFNSETFSNGDRKEIGVVVSKNFSKNGVFFSLPNLNTYFNICQVEIRKTNSTHNFALIGIEPVSTSITGYGRLLVFDMDEFKVYKTAVLTFKDYHNRYFYD